MAISVQGRNWTFATNYCAVFMALTFTTVLAFTSVVTPMACAQTFRVIHDFSDQGDGAGPQTGLTMDAAGNLYGTTDSGAAGYGTIFKLKRLGSDWTLSTLFAFGPNKGSYPYSRVTLASDGTLYGTTGYGPANGCTGSGCGTFLHLRPSVSAPKSVLTPWSETLLYSFHGNDGYVPQGDLWFDQLGNAYGTTIYGGANGFGCVYELTPSGAGWTENVLHSFQNNVDGINPYGGVVGDSMGNLFGVTEKGGANGIGAVYELSQSGAGWSEHIIYDFAGTNDGAYPIGGLIIDAAGNLYGTTSGSGSTGLASIFALTPAGSGWMFNILYDLPLLYRDHVGPKDKLLRDDAGNLYGTTFTNGAYNSGSVFQLSPGNDGYIYKTLYDFTGGSDGLWPISSLVMDASGNLYGTTSAGGTGPCNPYHCGVVFEITP